MHANFYRLWLPISIAFHVLLFVTLYFVPVAAAPIPGTLKVTRVSLVRDLPAPAQPVAKPPIVVPPAPPKVTPPKTQPPKTRGVKRQVGETKPRVDRNHGTRNPGARVENKPFGISGPGTSQKPAKAPEVVTGGGSKTVPVGDPAGTDKGGGDATEPTGGGSGGGGETYGAAPISIGRASYPKDSLNAGEEGTVVVLLAIDENGRVTGVDVSRSSGSSKLDREAVRAARKSTFSAAMKNGQAASSSDTVTYVFANGKVTAY